MRLDKKVLFFNYKAVSIIRASFLFSIQRFLYDAIGTSVMKEFRYLRTNIWLPF